MAGDKQLFRKKALAKLASPEQLDTLMQVTEPRGWLALAGLGLVLLAAVVWSFVGHINIKVDGMGILLRGESVQAVTADTDGRLTRITVRVGDHLERGDVVAEVDQPQLERRIAQQQEQLARMQAQDQRRSAAEQTNLEQSLEALDKEQQSVRDSIADYLRQIEALQEKVEIQQEMVDRGLITTSTLLATRNQLASARQAYSGAQVRLSQIDSERLTLRRNFQQQLESRSNAIEELLTQISELESRIAAAQVVRSPYSGRVLELMADPGELLGPGMPLLTMESVDAPIEAVVYVSAFEGKMIEEGMAVRVSPTTVKAEEYGFMLGEVRSVSDFPVTPQGLRRVLRNENLVNALTGDGAPVEVVVRLIPDPDTPSGFAWSSSDGPPTEVFSGTLCSADVITERKRPIEYVLPIFRGAVRGG